MANQKTENQQKKSVMSRVAAVQVAVMLLLTLAMVITVSSRTNSNVKNHLASITNEKNSYIEAYIKNAETVLSNYGCADEILNVVTEPTNPDYLKAAQKYTEKVSANIDNLEGIYVSKWDTTVLAHTYSDNIGDHTRDGEKLDELHNFLDKSDNNLYNAGIIISPVSGSQIISMYKTVYNNIGQTVGIVGLAVKTEDIVNDLNELNSGLSESTEYCMIDVNTGKYIFSNDKSKIFTDVSVKGITDVCSSFRNSTESSSGSFTFTEAGTSYYSVYNYNSDRGWLFIVDGTHADLFSLTTSMVVFLLLFSALYIVIAIVFNSLGKKQEETLGKLQVSLRKTEKTKESLNTAIFNDILTDCRNRISFTNDFEHGTVKDSLDYPYYFMMFNISEFSVINIMYGEDIGDEVLVSAANTIRSVLEGAELYRTGSDEFVAVMQGQNNSAGQSRIAGYADQTLSLLSQPIGTSAGPVILTCKASIVKKSMNVDPSVLPALKDIMNQSGMIVPGQIPFLDMDTLN